MTRKSAIIISSIILILFLVIWLFIFLYHPLRDFLTSPTALREWVMSFGIWSPLILITYHAIQVVFAPLPGLAVDITNGYIFGWPLGLLISYLGISLGSLIGLILAKRFGRPLVIKLTATPKIEKLDKIASTKGLLFLMFLFAIPGMPHDAMVLILGLTKNQIWKSLLISLIGRSTTMTMAVLLGASGSNLNPLQITGITILLLILLLPLLYGLLRKKV
ncbi:TVP38/TMEM64 family protein [Patescibacteria group bacterium]